MSGLPARRSATGELRLSRRRQRAAETYRRGTQATLLVLRADLAANHEAHGLALVSEVMFLRKARVLVGEDEVAGALAAVRLQQMAAMDSIIISDHLGGL